MEVLVDLRVKKQSKELALRVQQTLLKKMPTVLGQLGEKTVGKPLFSHPPGLADIVEKAVEEFAAKYA